MRVRSRDENHLHDVPPGIERSLTRLGVAVSGHFSGALQRFFDIVAGEDHVVGHRDHLTATTGTTLARGTITISTHFCSSKVV